MQHALKYTLRRLTEALAELQETVRAAIQAEAREPAEVVEHKCAQARDDVFQEVLVWIKNGQLTSFLYIGDHERDKTNERNWESLPDGDFWSTVSATRILKTGTATSNRHPRKGGTAYCRANEFDALAIEYIVDRRLKLDGLPKRFRFRNLTRNYPPEPPASENAPGLKKEMRGKPGPKSERRRLLTGRMLDDLKSGKRTAADLKNDTLTALVAEYGASPNTANAARADALRQFQSYSEFEL